MYNPLPPLCKGRWNENLPRSVLLLRRGVLQTPALSSEGGFGLRRSCDFVCPASALFEIHEIKCCKSALHIFDLREFFKAAYQITHTDAAFLHKIVLLIKAAVIFIAI